MSMQQGAKLTKAELHAAENLLRAATQVYEQAREHRNRTIRRALVDGWRHADIAAATDLSPGRITQIAQDANPKPPRPPNKGALRMAAYRADLRAQIREPGQTEPGGLAVHEMIDSTTAVCGRKPQMWRGIQLVWSSLLGPGEVTCGHCARSHYAGR